jgi:hypothetical protein
MMWRHSIRKFGHLKGLLPAQAKYFIASAHFYKESRTIII